MSPQNDFLNNNFLKKTLFMKKFRQNVSTSNVECRLSVKSDVTEEKCVRVRVYVRVCVCVRERERGTRACLRAHRVAH